MTLLLSTILILLCFPTIASACSSSSVEKQAADGSQLQSISGTGWAKIAHEYLYYPFPS